MPYYIPIFALFPSFSITLCYFVLSSVITECYWDYKCVYSFYYTIQLWRLNRRWSTIELFTFLWGIFFTTFRLSAAFWYLVGFLPIGIFFLRLHKSMIYLTYLFVYCNEDINCSASWKEKFLVEVLNKFWI